MYTKNDLNAIYERIAQAIDINEKLFDQAEEYYKKLGNWMDKETPDYKITIYPQGSFALGTVIKPISEQDEYDLDLVCQFDDYYGLDAKALKVKIVKPLLDRFDEVEKIVEKRRCWQVVYKNSRNFHMDIIPSIDEVTYIAITDKNEDNQSYEYMGSNPKGYIEWFNSRKLVRYKAIKEALELKNRKDKFMAEVEPIKEYKLKTPLQKAIQILKRHRDMMFKDDTENCAPISIIITTIAAQLYQNEDNIYDALKAFLEGAKPYIDSCKKNGKYYIENPSYTGEEKENFAEKWNDHPNRADAFFEWIEQAKTNLIDSIDLFDNKTDIAGILGISLGENMVQKVVNEYDRITANAIAEKIQEKELSLIPYRIRNLLSVPHRQKAPWTLPKGYRVFIKATVTDMQGNRYQYKNDGEPLDKGLSIEFTAVFTGKMPYTVKWQIVNTGDDARGKGCLRGEFENSNIGRNTRWEGTEYTGSHYIQCFIIKRGQCIAKSNIFIVNIK